MRNRVYWSFKKVARPEFLCSDTRHRRCLKLKSCQILKKANDKGVKISPNIYDRTHCRGFKLVPMAQAFTVQELKYLKMGVGLKLCETDMLLEDKAISRSFRKKLAREYRELIKLHNHLGNIFQGINRGD